VQSCHLLPCLPTVWTSGIGGDELIQSIGVFAGVGVIPIRLLFQQLRHLLLCSILEPPTGKALLECIEGLKIITTLNGIPLQLFDPTFCLFGKLPTRISLEK